VNSEATRRCFHCGEALDGGACTALVGGQQQTFCCAGCLAAAEWLHTGGLGDFYRLRSRLSPKSEHEADYSAWDSAAFQRLYVRPSDPQQSAPTAVEMDLSFDGIRCAACAWLIPKVAASLPGVIGIDLNPATGRARLCWNPQQIPLSAIVERFALLGYRARVAAAGVDAQRAARRSSLKRIAVAGLAAMQAMMMSEALYFGGTEMGLPTRDFFRVITLLLATPVVLWAGAPFFRGALIEWRFRRLGMDTLVALSIGLAYATSVVETLRGGPQVYFDAAVMFVFFLLVARHVEAMARDHARAGIDRLQTLPDTVVRVAGEQLVTVGLLEVAIGDVLQVAVGENIPADGSVESASAEVDESLLTGEVESQRRQHGERVLAGSVVLTAPVRIRVTALGAETWIAQLSRLVSHSAAQRPVVVQRAERWAARFVAVMIALAAAAGATWFFIDATKVLPVILAVLAAACPCAFALAVPATLTAAQARLARHGILLLHAQALERAAAIDRVAFDKTGTLTSGQPQVASIEIFDAATTPAQALALAAALERGHRHPLARAFGAAADAGLALTESSAVVGAGVAGVVAGHALRLGRRQFADRPEVEDDGRVWLSRDRQTLAAFTLTDHLRDEAAATISALHAAGFSTLIYSGDANAKVRSIAASLRIARAYGELRPEQKLSLLKAEQHSGHRIAMVGDGINDAPVLAAADLAIAIGEAAPMAQKTADVVLLRPLLSLLPELFATAHQAQRVLKQNLAWAVAYNTLMLPMAVLGVMPPWLAALGMSLSSLLVVLNAARLLRQPKPSRRQRALRWLPVTLSNAGWRR